MADYAQRAALLGNGPFNVHGIVLPLLRDVLYTLSLWRRTAGCTLAALTALAFGIGGATALFSIISALLLRPLPGSDSSRVVNIFTTDKFHPHSLVSMPDALDLKSRLHAASDVAILSEKLLNMQAPGQNSQLLRALVCDSRLFAVLGVQPSQGTSFFNAGENKALLSWQLWQTHFGGRQIIGDNVRLDDRVYVIAGILPKGFDLPLPADLWIPLEFDLTKRENGRAIHGYYAFARLLPGATLAQFSKELSVLAAQLALQNPAEDKGVNFQAVSLRDFVSGDVRIPLLLLFAAVAGVLLIACANIANLQLAGSASRIREIAVRISVGASRLHLFRQLMTESLLLSFVATGAGVSLAALALRVIKTLPDAQLPRPDTISLDGRVLLFAIGLTFLTAILFGMFPAWKASRLSVTEVLKQFGGRHTGSYASRVFRSALLIFETAGATALLIASLLLLLSFRNITKLDSGFQASHLLTFYLSLPDSRYGSDSIYAARFAGKLIPLLEALPGVKQAALTRNLPVLQGGNGPIQVEGRPRPANLWEAPFVMREEITSGYRKTLNVPLLMGRDLDSRDDVPTAEGILINQALMEKYFPGVDPIGKRISYKVTDKGVINDWREIVGVIGDTRRGTDQRKIPAIFVPMYRSAGPYPAVVVRTEGDPSSYSHAAELAVHKIDSDVPCFFFQTMDQVRAQQLGWRALNTSLLSIFASVALLLASVGIFSAVAYSVAQRTSEIGLRMACGATQANILSMILREGVGPAALGIAIGVVAAGGFGTYLQGLLFGVTLGNPWTYCASALVLLVVATAASMIPAARAATIDPWIALRYE